MADALRAARFARARFARELRRHLWCSAMRASIAFRSLRQRAIGTGLVEKRKVKQAKTRIAAAHFTTS